MKIRYKLFFIYFLYTRKTSEMSEKIILDEIQLLLVSFKHKYLEDICFL